MANTQITKSDIIAALATMSDEDVLEIGQELLGQLPWSGVGQGLYACALGPMMLITFNHTQNYGTPVKADGKSNKHPRVASSLGYKGIAQGTLGVTWQLNVIDTAHVTTQVGEPMTGGVE